MMLLVILHACIMLNFTYLVDQAATQLSLLSMYVMVVTD